MKYKPGDVVEIKRREEYNIEALSILAKTNYILTIRSVHPDKTFFDKDGFNNSGYYRVKEFEFMVWREEYIKCLYEELILDPIYSRFEILDL